jgi:hypothetical protein
LQTSRRWARIIVDTLPVLRIRFHRIILIRSGSGHLRKDPDHKREKLTFPSKFVVEKSWYKIYTEQDPNPVEKLFEPSRDAGNNYRTARCGTGNVVPVQYGTGNKVPVL